MALARPLPRAERVKYSPPTTFPAMFEFEILLYLSVKDLSAACSVSKAWATAIDDIPLCKIMLIYNKKDAEEEKDENTLDNRLLGCLSDAIKSQHIQSVHLLIALGVDVNKQYQGWFSIARSTNVKEQHRNGNIYLTLKSYFENPTLLAVASTVSSGRKGANIVHLLLQHDADIFLKNLKLHEFHKDEQGKLWHLCDDYYRPSRGHIDSDGTIKAFFELETLKQRPPRDDEYYGPRLDCGETCCILVLSLFILGGIIGMFILMPLFATILFGSLVLLNFGPNMVSAAKNS